MEEEHKTFTEEEVRVLLQDRTSSLQTEVENLYHRIDELEDHVNYLLGALKTSLQVVASLQEWDY